MHSLLPNKVGIGPLKSCQEEMATFCGREYSQGPDFSVNITMKKYRENMASFRIPHHGATWLAGERHRTPGVPQAHRTTRVGSPNVRRRDIHCLPLVGQACGADDPRDDRC